MQKAQQKVCTVLIENVQFLSGISFVEHDLGEHITDYRREDVWHQRFFAVVIFLSGENIRANLN